MVRLYIEDDKGKKDKENYVNICYSSILKSFILGWLGLIGIIFCFWVVVFVLMALFGIY